MSDLPEMLTDREVAAYFRLSPKNGWQTIQSWARSGRIKGIKIGDFWRFRKDTVMRLLEAGGMR